MEAMGAAMSAQRFSRMCEGRRVLLETDNSAVARAVNRTYSKNAAIMDEVKTVCMKTAEARIPLRTAHIVGTPLSHVRICQCHDECPPHGEDLPRRQV